MVGSPVNLTGQTGDVANQTLLATGHAAGFYKVLLYAQCTTAGTSGSMTYPQVKYNDGDGNRTSTVIINSQAAGANINLTQNYYTSGGAFTFYSGGGAAITCNTASGTYNGSPQYSLRARLVYLCA